MNDMIQARLRELGGPEPSVHIWRLVLQEVVLFGLWQAGLFSRAALQGCASLRILHGMPRYSQDLDFVLQKPDPGFSWAAYTGKLADTLLEFGIEAKIVEENTGAAIKRIFIIDASMAQHAGESASAAREPLRIRCSVDARPPEHSSFTSGQLDFPSDFEICHLDLPSNFALKNQALSYGPTTNGRDWFDFSWYVGQKVVPNLPLLESALNLFEPWRGYKLEINRAWLQMVLADRIAKVKWRAAKVDAEKFLLPAEAKELEQWNESFFATRLEAMKEYWQ